MKEQNSRAIAFTVAAAFFMETLDASIIATALPAIGAAFGTTALGVSASVTVYLVAMAVFVPAAGWCGERYGARRVFAGAVGVFTVAFLLPLMFQIGFGMSPTQAGGMVLVYMAGNLTMKSATTRVLRRFGFRRVLIVNGVLCAVTLFACGLLVPGLPTPLIYAALLTAGMTRSMNFTTVNTLAFADVTDEQRAGASALATMFQQVAMTLGVALAAFALGASQTLRAAPALALADFRNAWFVVAALMGLACAGALRLDPAAGAAISGKRP
ncbi:MAG: MFS transporter [Azoarcus sp.]|jgi:MFS family permease|nr:MFS transporter [Azoarcus sp.]